MAASDVVRLAVWSGPRNISTALMRSWENRDDTIVVDEPLYAHYLQASDIDHPGREEIVRVGETDWRKAVASLLGPVPDGVGVFYQKHMTHHLLPDVDRGWIRELSNVLLIRDPREVVASYIKSRPLVTVDDLGVTQQIALYDDMVGRGTPPPIIDARDFLHDPESYLRALCDYVGVRFSKRMLSWPAGPRVSDGPWGRYWYAAVWKSTGFTRTHTSAIKLEGTAARVADACMPAFSRLHEQRWVL